MIKTLKKIGIYAVIIIFFPIFALASVIYGVTFKGRPR